jgi:hypothetical protein
MTKESAVLRSCEEYLELRRHLVHRVNCGAVKTKDGKFIRFSDKPGWADLSGITFDGKPLAVECKSEKGRLSRHQEIFRAAWIARGGVYVLARSVEDLQEAGL